MFTVGALIETSRSGEEGAHFEWPIKRWEKWRGQNVYSPEFFFAGAKWWLVLEVKTDRIQASVDRFPRREVTVHCWLGAKRADGVEEEIGTCTWEPGDQADPSWMLCGVERRKKQLAPSGTLTILFSIRIAQETEKQRKSLELLTNELHKEQIFSHVGRDEKCTQTDLEEKQIRSPGIEEEQSLNSVGRAEKWTQTESEESQQTSRFTRQDPPVDITRLAVGALNGHSKVRPLPAVDDGRLRRTSRSGEEGSGDFEWRIESWSAAIRLGKWFSPWFSFAGSEWHLVVLFRNSNNCPVLLERLASSDGVLVPVRYWLGVRRADGVAKEIGSGTLGPECSFVSTCKKKLAPSGTLTILVRLRTGPETGGRILPREDSPTSIERIRVLEREIQEIKEAHTCCICRAMIRSIEFMCGHGACVTCAQTLEKCHLCSKPITKKIDLYF